MIEPEYFICNSNETELLINEYSTRAIMNRYSLNNDNFKSRWDKIK